MANNDVLKSKQLIEEFNKVWDEHSKFITKANTSLESFVNNAKIPSNYTKGLTDIKNTQDALAKSYEKVAKSSSKVSKTAKQEEQARLKELRLATKREKAFDRMDAKLKREEQQAQKTAQSELKLASAYNQLNAKLSKAEKEYKDLAASQGLNSKATIKQQKEVLRLRQQIDNINEPIKRFNNNVGNYKSALSGAGKALKGFVGAFGLVGGVYLFANAIKDTFNRIREFDKAMQNIAGIMRVSRDSIRDLEIEIKSVAGSSIKTSREVAELAENLVTLGKTKSEIKQLLKPVNDLAIGLDTTSAEASEFLVQTLNAFGAGSNEAEKYADIIATIRTSTSLDFQKMRDSFQYITPISKILNKDLAYTGAVIGLLADNGLKAESAGRLLATSQQKLAAKGIKLSDALEQVNQAKKEGVKETELLSLASELFGVQAAKIGIILAENSGKLEINAQKIRENGGALKELTDKQLESMDAKLKILDSTWEEFVLSISSGKGVIGNAFKSIINGITNVVKNMQLLSQGFENTQRSTSFKDTFSKLSKSDVSIDNAIKQLKNYRNSIKATEAELKDAEESLFSTRGQRKAIKKSLGFLKGQADAYREYIKLLRSAKPEIAEVESELQKANQKGTETKREKVNEIKLETIATQTGKEILEGKIKLLIEQRDKNDKVSLSYKVLNEQIEHYKKVLELTLEPDEKSIEALKERITAQEQAEKTLKALREETESYLESMSSGFLGDAGLGSLQTFFDGTFDKLMVGADTLEEKFAVTFNAISEVGQEAFNLINESSQANFNAEYARLEQQKEVSLQFAGDSTAAKEEIEKQYEKKRIKIQQREAKAEKQKAIFNIAVDTAQGVVAALAKTNIPLSIAIGAIGAAKLALVSAQQIPQFWQGGVVGGSQDILVNDDPFGKKGSNYKEVIEKPNGQILKPQGKNVKMNVPKGTIVHPTYDAFEQSLNDMLGNNSIAPFHNMGNSGVVNFVNSGVTKSDIKEVFSAEIGKLNQTIRNKENTTTNIDENGFKTFVNNGHSRKEVLNARHRGRGFSV